MMLLNDLLAPWFHYSGAERISALTLDSRKVSTGTLFVALPGFQVDGRKFITQAIESGAAAVLSHTDEPQAHGQVDMTDAQIPVIHFFQLHRQLSAIAAQFYPVNPREMAIIGITGTNGKTSVSQIAAQIIELMQQKAAVMGTLGNGLLHDLVDSGNTTADAITVMNQLRCYQTLGCQVCAMEVSSHGLVQGRVEAVPFTTAVFTNLSRDHLDFHGDMKAYAAAKKRIFNFPQVQHGIINFDDEIGKQWLAELDDAKYCSYSMQDEQADYYCSDIRFHDAGVDARIHYPAPFGGQQTLQLTSPLLGAFNLSNLLAVIAALHQQGYDMAAMVNVLPKVTPVPGRMERFSGADKATLVVDYAHTPDALTQALSALRVHCQGQLWCVFGCGGDRDKGKRPLMAQAAEQGADKLMVTSDNARSENPQAIIDDIQQGLETPEKALFEVDRVAAIKQVVALAKPGDVVLLAGKGHETYQEVAGEKRHYDERELTAKLMVAAL